MVPRLFMFAGVCVLVAALWAAQAVLVPIALAVLFTFLLAPLVRRLARWGVPHAVAVLTVVTATLLVVVSLGWVVFIQLNNLYEDLPTYRDEMVTKVQRIAGGGGRFSELERLSEDLEKAAQGDTPATVPASQPAEAADPDALEARTDTPDEEEPSTFARYTERFLSRSAPPPATSVEQLPPTTQPGTSAKSPLYVTAVEQTSPIEALGLYLAPLVGPIANAGIVFVLVIFMLLQREDLRDRLIRLMGRTQLHVTTQALNDAASRISRYMLAQAIVNGTYGLGIGIGLWVIGLSVGDEPFPSFVLWGLLCALLRFIPYVGPWIAAAFPILLSLAVYPGFEVFLWVAAMFIAIELASNNLMEPWLYGTSTGMSTLAVLISAVFWTWLWGPVGLLLATPMTVCLVVLGKYVPQLQFLDVLLGDEPVLDPPARIYQRLLAQDQEEAAELMTTFAADMDLLTLYETVLLPALAMCEADSHAGQIEPARQKYIHMAMAELIEEAADQDRLRQAQDEADEEVHRAKGAEGADAPAPPAESSAEPRPCRVLCLPASDTADELVGRMLAQLLEPRRYAATTISIQSLAGEMLQQVEALDPDVVVISALPPSATTRARYLCKRLQADQATRPMLVGLWTVSGDLKRARERLTCVASVQVVTRLPAAIEQIRQLTHQTRIIRPTAEAD